MEMVENSVGEMFAVVDEHVIHRKDVATRASDGGVAWSSLEEIAGVGGTAPVILSSLERFPRVRGSGRSRGAMRRALSMAAHYDDDAAPSERFEARFSGARWRL